MINVDRSVRVAAFKGGVVGGVVLTLGMAAIRALEVTPINMELALGSLLTRSFDSVSWVIGFFMHLAISGTVGVIYAAGFRAIRHTGVGTGVFFGFLHWIAAGILMGVLPALYSMIPELLGPPGFFGLAFGGITVLGFFALHLVYGAVVGGFARSAANQAAPVVQQPVQAEPLRRVA